MLKIVFPELTQITMGRFITKFTLIDNTCPHKHRTLRTEGAFAAADYPSYIRKGRSIHFVEHFIRCQFTTFKNLKI